MLDNITPVVLTYNEAPNIGRTLRQLRWARDIVMVDSFSDDDTIQIASAFPQVRILQRKFDTFANQCNFALNEAGIATDWVLSLDADYVLTDELVAELETLNPSDATNGFRAKFIYCIHGKRLRSGVYPPVTVLFRHSTSHYQDDGHAHRVMVEGETRTLSSRILHDDRKPLGRWLQSQLSYTRLEAKKIYTGDPKSLTTTARIRRLQVVAPLAMLFYCLIWRGGVLDGRAGFYYAFQRVLAETMVSLFLLDHKLNLKVAERIVGSELSERSS